MKEDMITNTPADNGEEGCERGPVDAMYRRALLLLVPGNVLLWVGLGLHFCFMGVLGDGMGGDLRILVLAVICLVLWYLCTRMYRKVAGSLVPVSSAVSIVRYGGSGDDDEWLRQLRIRFYCNAFVGLLCGLILLVLMVLLIADLYVEIPVRDDVLFAILIMMLALLEVGELFGKLREWLFYRKNKDAVDEAILPDDP